MYEKNIEKAICIAKSAALKLLKNEVPIDDLIVSKSLKRIKYSLDENKNVTIESNSYKNLNLPHCIVAVKREKRAPGSGPKSGERVPYIFIKTSNIKELQHMKAEDPDFVKQNNLQIDSDYYIKNSLSSPLESLFELFIDNPSEIFYDVHKQLQMDINDVMSINLMLNT